VAGACEYGSEHLGSVRDWERLGQVLWKGSALWSWLNLMDKSKLTQVSV
jgi:hypothetical protein